MKNNARLIVGEQMFYFHTRRRTTLRQIDAARKHFIHFSLPSGRCELQIKQRTGWCTVWHGYTYELEPIF